MQVKVFHIRLTKEKVQTDQENLNSFLDSVVVKKTSTELRLFRKTKKVLRTFAL
jgi:hypothetical protein